MALLPDQNAAVAHAGAHARLIAGPGTGKTFVLTGRVVSLVNDRGVKAQEILILTFTRAATQELKERALAALGEQADQPHIATLHSFALRQLLRNSNLIATLPAPLRIADDWEERHVVQEDLKGRLDRPVKEIQKAFNLLSADWESLTETQPTQDAQFVGAWRQHREVYGYTLRAELVYELKRALEQVGGFQLDAPIVHLLVDEYQDLNRCDLAIIRALVDRGMELFIAGDDDQSIYGFRKAHPDGIRNFLGDYPGAADLPLRVCVRCDTKILELAQFVAALDPGRMPKDLRARDDAGPGAVHLVRYRDQYAEANGIAKACAHLLASGEYEPHDILILLRSDWMGAYSRPIVEALQAHGLPVALPGDDLFDSEYARLVLALLRLCADRGDALAWRTILQLRDNGLGAGAFNAIYALAVAKGWRFGVAVLNIAIDPALVPRFGGKIAEEAKAVTGLLDASCPPPIKEGAKIANADLEERVVQAIEAIAAAAIPEPEARLLIRDHLLDLATAWAAKSIREVLAGVETANDQLEQAVRRGHINLLTMHRAKGLTAKAVFIPVAEKETIPGRHTGEEEIGDERRLLYVSLTRAKHFLCTSYCEQRGDQQQRLAAGARRQLTPFLTDAPLRPVRGDEFLSGLT